MRDAVRSFSVQYYYATRYGWLALIARGYRQCTSKVGTSPVDHPCLSRKNKGSSSARGSYLLELHDRGPGRAEQRTLALTRGLTNNVISESQAHREFGGHLYVYHREQNWPTSLHPRKGVPINCKHT